MINIYEMFAQIEEKALEDQNFYIVCGDGLDLLFFKKMVKQARDRIIACGISEQNQVSVANGIALQGKKVYCLMMTSFLVHRALDQLKMACYSNADIKFIGFSTNIMAMEGGYSHISIDDVAILKTTPNLAIYDPYTKDELNMVLQKSFNENTPMYIACVESSMDSLSNSSKKNGCFSKILSGARDFCIITSGDAANTLIMTKTLKGIAKRYKCPTVYTACQISPFDEKTCLRILKKHKKIMTFETRGTGALSSSVAEVIAKNGLKRKFMPVYFPAEKFNIVGYRNFASQKYLGLQNLGRCVKKFFSPFSLGLFSDKVRISNDETKIKHRFLGIPYASIDITPERYKRKIFGVVLFSKKLKH